MSIERDYQNDTYAALCDECGEVIIDDCETFGEMVEGVKAHGELRREAGSWVHYCDICRHEVD